MGKYDLAFAKFGFGCSFESCMLRCAVVKSPLVKVFNFILYFLSLPCCTTVVSCTAAFDFSLLESADDLKQDENPPGLLLDSNL